MPIVMYDCHMVVYDANSLLGISQWQTHFSDSPMMKEALWKMPLNEHFSERLSLKRKDKGVLMSNVYLVGRVQTKCEYSSCAIFNEYYS